MLIDRIYRKVQTFLNTEGRGNIDPKKFNELAHHAIQSRNEEYFIEIKRAIYDQNRGNMYNFLQNIPDRLQEKLLHYSVTDTLAYDSDSTRALPSDYKYIDLIEYPTDIDFEMCKNKREFNILKVNANSQFPIGFINGNIIRIYPDFAGIISITYLRNPLIPKWTYEDLGGGQYAFNPAANDFQDADIHASEEDEIVRLVLLYSGVNLKENDVQQFVMAEEQKEFRNENTD